MSADESPSALKKYRDGMKYYNEWERAHPIELTPEQAIRRVSEMYDFMVSLGKVPEPVVDTSGIERMNRILSKLK